MKSWKLYIPLAISALLVLITGSLIYYGELQKNEDTRNLLRTHKIIYQANRLFDSIREAENNQYNYIITENEKFRTHETSIKKINEQLDLLKQQIGDNTNQQKIINNELQKAIDAKIDEIKKNVRLSDSIGFEAATNQINSEIVRARTKKIRTTLDSVIKNEEQLIAHQSNELDQSYLLWNIIPYGGLFFIGATIVIAFMTIYRKNRENHRLINQLENRNDRLAEMHEREVKLSNEKSKFMSMAAHDLRSPLNAIISITELINDDKDHLTDEQKEYIDYISNAAKQMSELINNFLNVKKIEMGENNKVQAETVDVQNLLKANIMGFKVKAEEKDIDINFKGNCRGEKFYTDKAIFSQVSENLISNAIKFSPPEKTVTVSLSSKSDGFLLTVEDQGPGIKEEEIEKLYTPYADLSPEPTGDEPSTGLGLSIVKKQLDLIDGTITCKSQVGKGTTFIVHFPELVVENTAAE